MANDSTFTPGGAIDTWQRRRISEPNYMDVLAALLAGSQFGNQQQGPDLSAYMNRLEDLPVEPGEMSTYIDPDKLVDQFRNREWGPRASGVPYIFTGGSPFPQTEGQQRAEKIAATGAFASNMLNSINSVLPAILDAWNKRKKQGGSS